MSLLENLSPEVLKRLGRELSELVESPPEDIKIIFNEANITDIQAVISGPAGTPYEGGQFKIKLCIDKEFPATPPKGFFLTKVFHPNVATPSGEICVNTLKKDWTPDLGIKHVLIVVKCLLIHPNPESALNEEAGKLVMEDYESFSRKARMFTKVHALPPKPKTEIVILFEEDEKALKHKSKPLQEAKKRLKRL